MAMFGMAAHMSLSWGKLWRDIALGPIGVWNFGQNA